MPSKYAPLEKFLRDKTAAEREVTLTFDQIEKILKSKLPDSVHEMSWWEHETEGNHINKRAWSNAGWKVAEVNLKEKWARFLRN